MDSDTRKAIGKWLAGAVGDQERQDGIAHWADGWCYATNGHRIHAAGGGLSDRSRTLRCPWTSADLGWTVDYDAVLVSMPGPVLRVTTPALALLANTEGVIKAAKRAGIGRSPMMTLSLEPAEHRIVCAVSHGEFSAAMIARPCIYEGSPEPVVIALSARYLVEALIGLSEAAPDVQVRLSVASEHAPVRIDALGSQDLWAVIMPLLRGEDDAYAVQEVMAALATVRPDDGMLPL